VKKLTGKLGAKASFGTGALLAFLGIGKVNAEVSGEAGAEAGKTAGKTTEVTLEAISTPQRQLVQLTAHYLLTYPDRFFFVNNVKDRSSTEPYLWCDPQVIADVPRALAFINFPSLPKTKLIPIAAEFANGTIVTYFNEMKDRDGKNCSANHPDFDAPGYAAEKKKYWKWFADNFAIQASINLIEKSVQEQKQKIQWIAFRVPISDDGETLHIHLVGGARTDTCSFAYNFIRRGYEFGIRLVGTLKSDPDLNVLAVYER
jgi:hypothetical protein